MRRLIVTARLDVERDPLESLENWVRISPFEQSLGVSFTQLEAWTRTMFAARARKVALLVLLVGFSGCKVGPDWAACHDPLLGKWKQQLDQSLTTSGAVDHVWWTTFNDPWLNSLILDSATQNLTLQESAARIREARAQRGVVRGGLFPEVGQIDSFTHIKISDNGNPFGISGISFPPFDLWSTGFDAAWEIDVAGRVRRSLEAADADINASIEGYNTLLVTLMGDVGSNYVSLRATQQRILIAKENIRIQEETVRITEEKSKAGTVSPLDVAQAKSLLYQTRAAVPQFERELDRAENRLAVLRGRQPIDLTQFLSGNQPIPQPPPSINIGIPINLVRRRPDVLRAEWEVLAQSARIGVAVADLYPRLSLTGIFTLDAAQFSQLFEGESLAYRVGPSVRWNILNFGRVRSNIAVQDAGFDQAQARYRQTILVAVEEVENALSAYSRNHVTEAELREAVTAAREAARVAETQYREGAVNFQSLLDAQRSLALIQDRHIEAQGSVTLSVIQLYKSLGGGWDWQLRGTPVPAEAIAPGLTSPPPERLPAPTEATHGP